MVLLDKSDIEKIIHLARSVDLRSNIIAAEFVIAFGIDKKWICHQIADAELEHLEKSKLDFSHPATSSPTKKSFAKALKIKTRWIGVYLLQRCDRRRQLNFQFSLTLPNGLNHILNWWYDDSIKGFQVTEHYFINVAFEFKDRLASQIYCELFEKKQPC